ncbi:MAG TPA: hypothetical protein VFI70_04325 [Nitrososphaeraceae archaeon]|jgi:hypothetical protein|nr:hypothetical protein [Nitrososphaeraceae archaeon]
MADKNNLMTGSNTNDLDNARPISGLTAATCILKCLAKGYSQDQIVEGKFDGNRQLVSTWIAFLKDKHWVDEEKDTTPADNLKVTKKGKTWLKRFESVIRIN